MSEFLVKNRWFVTRQIWFVDKIDEVAGIGYDKLAVHGYPMQLEKVGRYKCQSMLQETLISDLSLSEDDLWSMTTKTVRNEINRSKRENVGVSVYRGKEISDDVLNEFNTMYHDMYEEKGMPGHYLPLNELKEYADKDALVITTSEIEGRTVVYHSYITDDCHSRFLQSCSEFRVADNSMRNAIGRANKYLHWNDWLYLKQCGVVEYDWGGIASYEKPNGIDKFKMSFGGQYRKYYNLFCDCSLAAKAYTGFLENKDKVRKFKKNVRGTKKGDS